MRIVQVKNIERKDVPIYYRRLFNGIAEFELLGKQEERPIDFTIETKPAGDKDIFITMPDPIDYPLVPLMKELKQFLINLDESGGLPG
ncbi:hypothetical protein AGMMS50267_09690 [Spirochaetia bacterium]|nr:hypothetical protein AGMMS50267_09690 [Spirochaetia bacterium]